MRFFHLVLFGYLAITVSASGYRAAAEYVLLWYAYQADLANPEEAQRSIGYRCAKWIQLPSPFVDHCDNNNYTPCKGTRPDKSCYFAELMGWISGGNVEKYKRRDITYPKGDKTNLSPDVPGQIQLLLDEGLSHPVPPYNALRRGGMAYNDMIRQIGHVFGDARGYASIPQEVLTRGQMTLGMITEAREVDHSDQIKKVITGMGLDYGDIDTGRDYPTYNKDTGKWVSKRRKFDLQATVNLNSGVPDAEDKILRRLAVWYGTGDDGDPSARDHKEVIDSYRLANDLALGNTPSTLCACPRCGTS